MAILGDYTNIINKSLLNLVSFISILIIGLVIGRFLWKLTYKLLHELEVDRLLTKRLNAIVQLEKVSSKFVQYSIYTFSIVYALSKLGINLKFFYYILVILLIFIVVYLLLQVKDYIHNLFIGTFFVNKEFLKVGQRIKLKNIEGLIVKVTVTEIKVVTKDNDTLFIPNAVLRRSSLFKKL